ncbi:hypothetical protein SCAR479_07088 [Seiridium cardinale]|uniref:histidine kinase n=1 Tax=Seiridium cardinale TaxID=138064 RepID=A0ABR2XR99_9PEZI
MGRVVSEGAREREALKFATVFIAESTELMKREAALSSADSSLTAFAQLGALKLGATRCLISIFDQKNQYIIAEATPASALTPNTHLADDLWLGCIAIPRTYGVCEHLLTAGCDDPTDESKPPSTGASSSASLPVSVISNLAEDSRYNDRAYISNAPHNRFYAGVPLRTSRGIHIGSFCIFDDQPRDGLDSSQLHFMQGMSCAVMGHLELRRSAESASRSERMVRGIGSFVEGKSTMSNLWRGTHSAAFEQGGGEGQLNRNQQTIQKAGVDREVALEESAEASSRHIFDGATAVPNPAGPSDQAPLAATSNDREENKSSLSKSPSPSPKPKSKSKSKSNSPLSSPNSKSKSPSPDSRSPPTSGDQDSRSLTDRTVSLTKFTLNSSASVTSAAPKSFADELHSTELREAFGKAANIIRESIEVEGVAFLDAVVDTFGGLVSADADSEPTSSDSQADTSSSDGREEKEEAEQRHCRIFGFSTSDSSSIDGKLTGSSRINIPQKFLRTLLRRYPAGKTFTFDNDGEVVSGDSEEDRAHILAVGGTEAQLSLQERKRTHTQSRQSESAVLASILVGARSVAMVPLWDPIRERWHAGAFVWTRTPDRIFSMEKEVSYLRAFGSTIMAEINRIEATQSEKMKSDLLGSLSHELRSPLHGVLAGIELIQDSELNAFQGDALHSMESCGRTLLDVIEHLLDFSKMNRFVKASKAQKKARPRGRGQLKEQQQAFESKMAPLTTDIDLSLLIEETVESVYAGFGYERLRVGEPGQAPVPGSLYSQDPYAYQDGHDAARFSSGGVTVYLDIDANERWTRHIQPGGLRRIVMNIIGNSMKYTNRGYIVVKMRQVLVPLKRNRHRTNLVITISDSGKGITEEFLRDKIFVPFNQEDSLQPGTGLGLSLIHQIITLLNGSITVESQLGHGTSFQVTLPLSPAKPTAERSGSSGTDDASLKGLRVSLRGFKDVADDPGLPHFAAPVERDLLATMCRTWLQLEIVPEDSSDTRPDCILCTDLSLDQVKRESSGLLPPVVVVCRNTAIAQNLVRKHRKEDGNDFFEFISQPIGPHKLSKALALAMERWKRFTTSPAFEEALSKSKANNSVVEPTTGSKDEEAEPNGDTPFPLTAPLNLKDVAARSSEGHNEPGPAQLRTATQSPASVPNSQFSRESDHEPTSFLIVDDNKINLQVYVLPLPRLAVILTKMQILSAFMKKMKRSYKSATDGLEALEIYAATPGHFRCILMDISMPVMDGLEATRRIREFEQARQLPQALIVALTGMASGKVQQEAFGSGVDFFLPKPWYECYRKSVALGIAPLSTSARPQESSQNAGLIKI